MKCTNCTQFNALNAGLAIIIHKWNDFFFHSIIDIHCFMLRIYVNIMFLFPYKYWSNPQNYGIGILSIPILHKMRILDLCIVGYRGYRLMGCGCLYCSVIDTMTTKQNTITISFNECIFTQIFYPPNLSDFRFFLWKFYRYILWTKRIWYSSILSTLFV